MHKTFRETVRAGKEALFLHFDPDPQFVLDFMRYVGGRLPTTGQASESLDACTAQTSLQVDIFMTRDCGGSSALQPNNLTRHRTT